MRATAIRFYDIERLCAAVVGAVKDGTDGQTEGKPEFVTSSSRTCCRRNEDGKERGQRRSETYRAWTFCWWMFSRLRYWMIFNRMWRQSCTVYRHLPLAIIWQVTCSAYSGRVQFIFVFYIDPLRSVLPGCNTFSLVRYRGEPIDSG